MKNLQELQKLSLDDKIEYSKTIIREYYKLANGKIHVAYSGGKDSTVLLHLVRSIYPNTPGVFINTGAEFPEILDQVRSTENVIWLEPKKNFQKVCQDYGYCVISKEVSDKIYRINNNGKGSAKFLDLNNPYNIVRYDYLFDAPFRIANRCCYYLKTAPMGKFERESGSKNLIATRAEESRLRLSQWRKFGEIIFNDSKTICTPMSIWTEKDEQEYINRYDIKLCDLYYRGWTRTGCVYCLCAIKYNKDKFINLKQTHPDCWEFAMKPLEDGGLGYKPVLEFLDIPTGEENL